MKSFLFLLVITAQAAWSQTSYVAPAILLEEKGHELFLGAEYFQTTKLTDRDFVSGEKFNRLQGEAGVRYGAAKNFQLGLGARFRRHESVLQDPADPNNQFSDTNSGIQSLFTTLHYGFTPMGRMHYALEGFYRYTPYSNTAVDNASPDADLVLGDQGNEFGGGLLATYATPSNNYFSLRGGWRDPGTYLSPEIYWQAEAALAWRRFALVAGVDGVSSLNNGNRERPNYFTGATNLYHGYNREWVTPYAGFNLALGNTWRIELRGSQVVSGRSTDLGRAYGINLVRRVEDVSKKTPDARFKTYDTEVTVTKVSPKKNYVVIDKGLSEDIEKGMKFDFFEYDYLGGNVLVARGIVIKTNVDSAIVKITQHYNLKKEIKTGLVGRAKLR